MEIKYVPEIQYVHAQATEGSIRDFLTILFKHKIKIISIFIATVVMVTAVTFLLAPVYEAKSSLLVKIGRENIYRPEVGDNAPVTSVNQEEVINSEVNILTSQDLIEKVVTALKIENIYPDLVKDPPSGMTPLNAAIIKFKKKLNVEGVKKSNVIEVTFQNKNPRIAAKAVNLLVDFYTVKHLQLYSGTETSFLDRQQALNSQKLKESADDLELFKQKNHVFSLDEQRSLLLQQRSALDTELKTCMNSIVEQQKRVSSLNGLKQAVAADSTLYTNSELDKIIVDAKARLLDLKLKEQELLKKYKEKNPLVQHVRGEIKMVRDFLAEQEKSISGKVKTGNLVYQEVEKGRVTSEADLDAQRVKAVSLKQQLAQVNGEIQSLDLRGKRLAELTLNYDMMNKNYRTYAEKTEEAHISDDMNRNKLSNVSVIQTAKVPAKPIKPKKLFNIALGIILGAVSGLGFAFFSEYTSQVISLPENAEKRLCLPVLSVITEKEA